MGAYQFRKAGRSNIRLLKSVPFGRINVVILAALFLVFVIAPYVPHGSAQITGERSFSSTASDAQLSYFSTNFTEAWDAYAASWTDALGTLLIGGMEYAGGQTNICRSTLYFSTGELPDDGTITSAILQLYVVEDHSTTDFNITIQGTGTYPHEPAVAADFYRGWYGTTNLGSRSSSEISGNATYFNITLSAAGIARINATGTTRFVLRSQEDIDGSEPAANEWIWIAARDLGESYAAKLVVNYDVAAGDVYNYYFLGPYEDGGGLFNGTAHVTFFPNYNTTIEFDLTSDGSTADTEAIALEQQAVLATWNISASGNYSRVFYFTSDATETIYVTVPDPDLPTYLYGFTINDFVGVENGFLESTAYINGATRVIERQQINTINAAPFYMTWSRVYGMRVQADQGEVTVGQFTALSDTNPTVIIPAGAFPQAFEGLAVSVAGARVNGTLIQVNYTDSEEGTYWIRVYIRHRLSTGSYYTDYYENTTSNTYQLNWNSAHNQTDYVVQVQAYRGTTEDWTFHAPYQRGQTNVWSGLNYLGDGLPIEAQYLPAVILVIAAALAFSYWHVSAGAWIAWATAAVCFMFNWLPYDATASPAVLGLGAVICAGITIGEFKKGERTV